MLAKQLSVGDTLTVSPALLARNMRGSLRKPPTGRVLTVTRCEVNGSHVALVVRDAGGDVHPLSLRHDDKVGA